MPYLILFLPPISYALSKVWRNFGPLFSLIIFPGIIVHELWHLVGCLLTGAKIKKVKISKDRGSVKHKKPKIPLFGPFIISTLPFPGAILTIYLLSSFLNISSDSLDINSFSFNIFTDYRFSLFLYLSAGIIICMIPSKKDLKNATYGILLALVVIFFIYLFDFTVNLPESFLNIISFSFSVSVFILFISIPFYLLKIIFFD